MKPPNCIAIRSIKRRIEASQLHAQTFCTALFALLVFIPCGNAQKTAGDISPEVQRLYQEAHDAQAQGDSAKAIERYQEILKAAPRLLQAYNNLGLLYYQKRDYAQAETILEKGLKLDPGAVTMSALLGSAQYSMGKYAQARPHLEAAVKGNPSDDFARALYGRVLF